MNKYQVHFLLAEFTALKAEISALMANQRHLMEYALLISAIAWSWFFSDRLRGHPIKGAVLLPGILTSLLGLLSLSYTFQVKHIGSYIAKVEEHLKLPQLPNGGLGWETYLASEKIWNLSGVPPVMVWLVVIVGNFILAWYVWDKIDVKS